MKKMQVKIFCVYAIFFALFNFGEVHFYWTARSTVEVNTENLRFLLWGHTVVKTANEAISR